VKNIFISFCIYHNRFDNKSVSVISGRKYFILVESFYFMYPLLISLVQQAANRMYNFYSLLEIPADSKLAISFKNCTALFIIGYATAQPVPSPNLIPNFNIGSTPK
jgi:hypothetical protein